MACPSHSRSISPCPLHFSINVLYSKLSDNTTGQKSTISHFASVLFDNCDSFVILSYPCPGPSDLFSKISFDYSLAVLAFVQVRVHAVQFLLIYTTSAIPQIYL